MIVLHLQQKRQYLKTGLYSETGRRLQCVNPVKYDTSHAQKMAD